MSPQVIISSHEETELVHSAKESPDESIDVEYDSTLPFKPISANGLPLPSKATPLNVRTTRTESVNKPTAIDLIEPLDTTRSPPGRSGKTSHIRFDQEIVHATFQKLTEANEITASSPCGPPLLRIFPSAFI